MSIAIGVVIGSIIVAILQWLVSLVLELFGTILQAFGVEFVENFGTFNLFNEYFETTNGDVSWMDSISTVFVGIGVAFCSLLLILGLVRNILSGLGFAGESPFQMIARVVIAFALTYKLRDVLVWLYSNVFQVIFEKIGEGFGIIDAVEDTAGMNASFSGGVVKTIVMLFLIVIIMKKLLEVIAEFVERYLLCAFLVFVAPLISCAVILKSTMKVFSTYLKMFFGQAMILVMSSVSLQMIIVCMKRMVEKVSISEGFMDMLMPMLITYAFLRVVGRLDNYMRDIGLTVGVTGGDMFTDLRSAAMSVFGLGRSISSKVGGFAKRAPGAADSLSSSFKDSKGANYMSSANRMATDKGSFGSAISNAAEAASKNFGQKEGTNPYGGVFGGVKQAFGLSKASPAQKFGDGFNFRDATNLKDGIKQVENFDGSTSKMWRQADSNGNSHLFEMSDKKMDGPGTSQFTAANGQKFWVKDHDVAAAVTGKDADLKDAMERFDNSDMVVSNPETSSDNASPVGPTSDSAISCNNQNVADAFNSMEENGVNVADFQATVASGVEVSPATLEAAQQMKDVRMQDGTFEGPNGHGEFIEETGATVVSAADVAAGEAIRDAELPIDSTSVGVVDALNNNGELLSPEAINAGYENNTHRGNMQTLDTETGETTNDIGMSMGSTNANPVSVINGEAVALNPEGANVNAFNAANESNDINATLSPNAANTINVSNVDTAGSVQNVQGTNISTADYSAIVSNLGANYGYNPAQSMEFANIGKKHGLDSTQTFDVVGKIRDSGYQVNNTSINTVINAQRSGDKRSVKNILNSSSPTNKNIRKIKKKKGK